MFRSPSFRRCLLIAGSWSVLAGAAAAQEAPERDEPARVDDIVVTGVPYGVSQNATTIATTVLDQEALSVAPPATLGDLLSGTPGLRSTAFAPGASRPVIRGLTGPRVQVLTNGVGLIDASSVSPDHQVAADPAESDRIEIIRGPSTLAYGGTAIGGVVNVFDGRIPEEMPDDGLSGQLTAQASSVDDGTLISGRTDVAVGPSLVLHLDALRKRADDYDIPAPAISQRLADRDGLTRDDAGTLANSFAELDAYGVGASYVGDRGFLGASFKNTESTYGVVAEEDVFIDLEQQRIDVRGGLDLDAGPFREARLAYGHADYTHTEFEDVGQPGTIFASVGQEARVDLIQRNRGPWKGAVGGQMLSRDFEAIGDEAYIPGTRIEEGGLYAVQRLDFDGYGFEGGLRWDRRTLTATPLGTTTEVERRFDNWSASAAAFVQPSPGLFLGLSVAHNARAPSEVELFADGLHVATAAYEVGDPTLDSEKVTTIEATAHLDRGALRGDLHVYTSKFDGFIDAVDTGTTFTVVDGGLTEEFPIFAYAQTDADFRGFEAEVAYDVWTSGDRVLTLEGAADHVRADTDLGVPARIPPYSLTGRAKYASRAFDASLEVRRVGEQDRVAQYELPTDGYTLVNLFGAWRPFGDPNVTVFAEGRNLTNEEVREHSSFLKDVAPAPGRNLRLGVSYRF